ncbi:sigma-E factor negative regulatory protein [Aquabacterium sp. OR-4]|uniref:sigma-E factor negative regulatory protein n=1 Tax=Aquabacterium sp. OR-4 TaxID=2978127 RepID=UPI0028C7892E|nr:sigma-E factor negative regulatory protein [Aquabacterium sp. OR-4]MDT7834520.1 sigma-E factor negative regulatory protein [Aquabacterium sp. OR-4]
MVSNSDSSNAQRETLSSLMDGELPPEGVRAPCSRWRADAQARDAWHTYHLIGDVLRSEDLASTPQRDEAFLQRLRERLATEPVPMAPLPAAREPAVAVAAVPAAAALAATVPQRRAASRRFAPMAVAAGVVVVAGVVGVMRAVSPLGPLEPGLMATATSVGPGLAASVPGGSVPMTMVRDARLDRYIATHRKLANGFVAPDHDGAPVAVVYESR